MCTVTVLEIGRGRVRLGFAVSNDVPVNRLEVLQRMGAIAATDSRREDIPPPVA
jgi:sRNA-binding carbon storage regulator CsrA